MIGTTLAHYRITAALGAGGMGEVWRATDEKLGRDVALKVVPEEFARDPVRMARFEREAKVLASLNHPNIATLYGLETVTSGTETETGTETVFLAMELVEGLDLSERIARGSIPVDEAIPIALQIAEALEAAHEQGIVHRDLKPANIKLTEDGVIKVLDFGLAKEWVAEGVDSSSSMSPTLTQHATAAGVILGTAAYMSPEQARGKKVDRRADIWAFGVVLWEMLTARRLFEGDTVTDVLAAVVRQEIDLKALPTDVPATVHHMLGRCFDRDPRTRLRDIGEARVALNAQPGAAPDEIGRVTAAPRRWWIGIAAACLLIGLALGMLVSWPSQRERSAPNRPARTIVLPADGRSIDDSQAISPDGRWVAFTADGRLWIRNLGELEGREVPDSDGARLPFWSPRSDAVGFAVGDGLFSFSVQGGSTVELCRFSGGDFTGGAWSEIEGIVFTLSRASWDGDVLRVPEDGGTPEPFTRADSKRGERRLHQPHFFPNGQDLLYTVVTRDVNSGEVAVDRDGVRSFLDLGPGATRPAWSPTGHIMYSRGTGLDTSLSLWALPFSLETMTPTGEPFRIAASGALASVSANGTLVFGLLEQAPQQLVWVDRGGHTLGTVGDPIQSTIWSPAISPDGRRIAATVDWDEMSVWDADRSVRTRVSGESESPLFADWLPNGREIAYSLHGGGEEIVVRRADGSGDARVLLRREGLAAPSFSPDGALFAFYIVDPDTGRDLWAAAVDSLEDPFVLLRTPANEALPRISPDGEYVAYQSDASGRWEVYVQPFPEGEGRWQISSLGGQHPRWNPQGNELFFVSGDDLMAVEVGTKPEFRVGTPFRLFSGAGVGTRLSLPNKVESFYDVAPDGQRFVVVRGVRTGTSEIVVADGLLEPRARRPEVTRGEVDN